MKRPLLRVVVLVRGGVAEPVTVPAGVSVEIRDYDDGGQAPEGEYKVDKDGGRYASFVTARTGNHFHFRAFACGGGTGALGWDLYGPGCGACDQPGDSLGWHVSKKSVRAFLKASGFKSYSVAWVSAC